MWRLSDKLWISSVLLSGSIYWKALIVRLYVIFKEILKMLVEGLVH